MKKISVTSVKEYMKQAAEPEYKTFCKFVGKNDKEVEIVYKDVFTIEEESTFIDRIIDNVFDDNMRFRPEYVQPMVHATLIQMFTNLPTIPIGNSEYMDVRAMDRMFYIFKFDKLNCESWDTLSALAGSAVKYEKDKRLAETSTASDRAVDEFANTMKSLTEVVNTLGKKVNDINMNEMIEYAGRLSNATQELQEGSILNGLIDVWHKENSFTKEE